MDAEEGQSWHPVVLDVGSILPLAINGNISVDGEMKINESPTIKAMLGKPDILGNWTPLGSN